MGAKEVAGITSSSKIPLSSLKGKGGVLQAHLPRLPPQGTFIYFARLVLKGTPAQSELCGRRQVGFQVGHSDLIATYVQVGRGQAGTSRDSSGPCVG